MVISDDDIRFNYDRDVSHEVSIKYCNLLSLYLEKS